MVGAVTVVERGVPRRVGELLPRLVGTVEADKDLRYFDTGVTRIVTSPSIT